MAENGTVGAAAESAAPATEFKGKGKAPSNEQPVDDTSMMDEDDDEEEEEDSEVSLPARGRIIDWIRMLTMLFAQEPEVGMSIAPQHPSTMSRN